MIDFQFNFILENAVTLLDCQLSGILCGIGLLNREGDAVHFVIPYVLGLHVQSGHLIRIMNVNLENKFFNLKSGFANISNEIPLRSC